MLRPNTKTNKHGVFAINLALVHLDLEHT
jgi:hypothetical protein